MKLEVIETDKKQNKLHLRLQGVPASFANLVRRFAMDEVPTLAIEDVEFKDNSSALYDEIIAHRLGLMPIKTDSSSYNLKEECSCNGEGCAKCQLKISLKSAKKGIVTASEAESQDPKCTFALGYMPVAKLSAKQKLDLEATAVMGKGIEHAKWSPCLAYYKKEATINTSNLKLDHDQKARVQRACNNLVKIDGKIEVSDQLFTNQRADACIAVLKEAGAEVVEIDSYIFTVESWGQLECKQILDQAADIIIQKLDALKAQLT